MRCLLFACLGLGLACGNATPPSSAETQTAQEQQDAEKPPVATALPIGQRSLNGLPLAPGPAAFRFFTGGHLYGSPDPKKPRPALTWTSSKDRLIAALPRFFMGLGDLFCRIEDKAEVERTLGFLKTLPFPVLNAVGNHDLGSRKTWWSEQFGPNYYAFRIGVTLFLVLDSETKEWRIMGDQLKFLKSQLAAAREDSGLKTVFLFTHKMLWADSKELVIAALASNQGGNLLRSAHFAKDLFPATKSFREDLVATAKTKSVHWISGDTGAFPNRYHVFLQREESSGITFVATGLGDLARDCLVQVDVSALGDVHYSLFALGSERPEPIENYDAKRWTDHYYPEGIPQAIHSYVR